RIANRSTASCPGWAWCPDDGWAVVNVRLRKGSSLRGFARNQGKHDIQLQTLDGRLHLLKDTEYTEIKREAQSIMPPLNASDQERRGRHATMRALGGVARVAAW